ncbi:hypothetical protein DT065_03005 [Salicibibacter kimchii]|uniref:Uncharacterized protein n=1 Tax=Salicibibacter kimchii TaxID=2099786 RepID=A0A345BVV4_9BACI|nr:hypothetical protein DT065_03005 [Salicibibacter kimchii]
MKTKSRLCENFGLKTGEETSIDLFLAVSPIYRTYDLLTLHLGDKRTFSKPSPLFLPPFFHTRKVLHKKNRSHSACLEAGN